MVGRLAFALAPLMTLQKRGGKWMITAFVAGD
jgi:hypothetical protein